mmetsp:Transcript_171153/g.548597  ORF Transcript_171153/g.548597 Transcript_171153/m.548597 type:complete len:483 (-) Transcript_171153:91-1539(-)
MSRVPISSVAAVVPAAASPAGALQAGRCCPVVSGGLMAKAAACRGIVAGGWSRRVNADVVAPDSWSSSLLSGATCALPVAVLTMMRSRRRRGMSNSLGKHWGFSRPLQSFRRTCCTARGQESEAERLRLDKEAREGMEAYMVQIEQLAQAGNVRAQKTAWKWTVRKKVWNYLEDNDLADFPRPVHHRIPNFKGSADAGLRVAKLPEFLQAKVVKVNPDTPQKSVRVEVLRAGKVLYVPQPRLRTGFFSRLLPGKVPPEKFSFAATAGGMKELAEPMTLEDRTKIDMVVVGSTAINPETGARVGKGEGFAELEYGIMRQLGMIDESTPVVTCVHDCQVISEDLPPKGQVMMEHDVPVDIIVTPTRTIYVNPKTRLPKPTGIYWHLLSEQKIAQIKVLRQLKAQIERETGSTIQLAEQEEALPPLAKRGEKSDSRSRGRAALGATTPGTAQKAVEAKADVEEEPLPSGNSIPPRLSRPQRPTGA